MNITTTNFADFGSREREMAEDLLRASREQGFPEDFDQAGVTIMMNMNSGNVFFANEDYQVAMMHSDKLESFYSCPECGNEGFKEEMLDPEYTKKCCVEYFYSDIEDLLFYDNGGKSFDRYTAVWPDLTYLGMSEHPSAPQGFGQHGELKEEPGDYLGKDIEFEDLPRDCKQAVISDLEGAI